MSGIKDPADPDSPGFKNELMQFRAEIDAIDEGLVSLIDRRLKIVPRPGPCPVP